MRDDIKQILLMVGTYTLISLIMLWLLWLAKLVL